MSSARCARPRWPADARPGRQDRGRHRPPPRHPAPAPRRERSRTDRDLRVAAGMKDQQRGRAFSVPRSRRAQRPPRRADGELLPQHLREAPILGEVRGELNEQAVQRIPVHGRGSRRMLVSMPLITFGHGTASAERIAELLLSAGVSALVDVRTAPGSRRHPHVARAELERWLPGHGISYRWEKRLGGFRRPGAGFTGCDVAGGGLPGLRRAHAATGLPGRHR